MKLQALRITKIRKTNVRIVIVLLIQTNLLILIFFFDLFNILRSFQVIPGHSDVLKFPYWVKWLTEGETTLKCFRQIRIFIDSIAILMFMSGYREDLVDSVLWFLKVLLRVKKKIFPTKMEANIVLPEPWIIPNVAPFRRSF